MHGPKFLGLLLAAVLIAALKETVVEISAYIWTTAPSIPPTIPNLPAGHYQFLFYSWSDLLPFLPFIVSPVLLFLVFYRLGRRADVGGSYILVATNLFIGGVVGTSIPYFLSPPLIFGRHWAVVSPDTSSFATTIVGLLLTLIGFGLSVLFPAFFAITIANFRSKSRISSSRDTE